MLLFPSLTLRLDVASSVLIVERDGNVASVTKSRPTMATAFLTMQTLSSAEAA
jgi:hypothetical protein